MRYFLKCADCLSVVAVDADLRHNHGIVCECGGKLAVMGIVRGKRIANPELACPCDDRCTNAPGPNCDCRCNGKNHGSKKLVEVWKDAGGIPRVKPCDPAAMQCAQEFRAAKEAARARLYARHGVTLEKIRAGSYEVDGSAYYAARAAEAAYYDAKLRKNHKARMAELAKVCV